MRMLDPHVRTIIEAAREAIESDGPFADRDAFGKWAWADHRHFKRTGVTVQFYNYMLDDAWLYIEAEQMERDRHDG